MLILLMLVVAPSLASAHTNNSEGFSLIEVKNTSIDYQLQLDAVELSHAVGFQVDEQASAVPEKLKSIISENKVPIEEYLNTHILMYADSMPVNGTVTTIGITKINEKLFANLSISYAIKKAPENLIVKYNIIFESDPSHANMAKVIMNGKQQEFIFTYEVRELNIGEMSAFTKIKQFFVLGLKHIFTGYDHILFVISLLIGAMTVRHILSLVTAFTIAHSLTLALATLDIVQLPGKLVESAIALSIVYVALKNIFTPESKHAPWIAFAFGLIHGFGFAGILSELHLGKSHLAAALVSFNLGIEAGQLLIVTLVFPILLYLSKNLVRINKWVTPSISTAVLLFGFVWFIERAF
ncbi:HupE/UreJ family protein [Paenibacillus catalpae]|uniref:HupE/UreJ family protein n=1 Tax=Paenibacillus catalpae TaxID=1045775 RepID=UPI001FEA88C0|nr:HupE/UreJ family protein [Paenibacillus catalpae]